MGAEAEATEQEAQVPRGVWGAQEEEVTFTSTITDIHRISDGYRIRRIFLVVWSLMGREISSMGTATIRLRGRTGCARGMACESHILGLMHSMLIDLF